MGVVCCVCCVQKAAADDARKRMLCTTCQAVGTGTATGIEAQTAPLEMLGILEARAKVRAEGEEIATH